MTLCRVPGSAASRSRAGQGHSCYLAFFLISCFDFLLWIFVLSQVFYLKRAMLTRSPVLCTVPPQDQPAASSSLGNRQMPPPSPPPLLSSRGQPASAPQPSPSFLTREIPTNPGHRPGSSMSISSMLGSDNDRLPRDTGTSLFSRPSISSLFGPAPPSSASAAMSPPSAPARPSSLDYPLFHRSQTPDKPFPKNQSGRAYRSGSSSGLPGPLSEQHKFGGLSRTQPPSQYPERHSPRTSSSETPYIESRRLSISGPIPRPNSQPQHIDSSMKTPGYSPLTRPGQGHPEGPLGRSQRSGSFVGLETHPSRFGSLFLERQTEEQVHRERERTLTRESDLKPPHAPLRFGSQYMEREATDRLPNTVAAWDLGRSQPPSPESKRFPVTEAGSGFGFGAIQSYTKSLGSSQVGASRQPSLSMQSRQDPSTSEPPHLSKVQSQPRLFSTTSASTMGQPSFSLSAPDDHRRKGSDELLQHRNLLGVGVESKRGGRASPLPQAVQGAQAQIVGPAAEPSIKNELGRVFSGIGSGLGGVNATASGNGSSTPMAASPFKRDSIAGRSTVSETATDDAKIVRPASATGKRQRKLCDDDSQLEGENAADLRSGVAARGRRGRHVHYHHHQYAPPPTPASFMPSFPHERSSAHSDIQRSHHHHRHNLQEDATIVNAPPRAPSSMNFFHRTSTPSEGVPLSGAALGHHHHHHHHHHHPPPRSLASSAAAMPVLREPRTIVNIEPLLASVVHLPRHHLGSTLYAPHIGVPTEKESLESAKFGYTTTPQPIPRFDGKENCTFTVRVPRFRIDASHREEICARRALWGTGVYTDDSDPVAAAIHSGFIRGAWGEDVDTNMLDLEIRDSYQHAPQGETAASGSKSGDAKPRIPPIPPPDKDLHITLLILPKLERYESSVLFGIKSRSWGGTHDGVSFKVLRIDWVDEGVGRGEERGGEARRKRLRNMMRTGRICTGPGLVKLQQLRGNAVQIHGPKTNMDDNRSVVQMQTVS